MLKLGFLKVDLEKGQKRGGVYKYDSVNYEDEFNHGVGFDRAVFFMTKTKYHSTVSCFYIFFNNYKRTFTVEKLHDTCVLNNGTDNQFFKRFTKKEIVPVTSCNATKELLK